MKIRPVVAEDYPQWRKLWDAYLAISKTELANEITDTTWRRFLDPAEPMYALVAEKDGRLIAFAHCIHHRNVLSIKDNCYAQDLFTLESERNKGMGRALCEAIFNHARAHGITRVYWQTAADNKPARHLYDQLAETTGFVIYRKWV